MQCKCRSRASVARSKCTCNCTYIFHILRLIHRVDRIIGLSVCSLFDWLQKHRKKKENSAMWLSIGTHSRRVWCHLTQLGDPTEIADLLWSLWKGTRLPRHRASMSSLCMTKQFYQNSKITEICRINLCIYNLGNEKKILEMCTPGNMYDKQEQILTC